MFFCASVIDQHSASLTIQTTEGLTFALETWSLDHWHRSQALVVVMINDETIVKALSLSTPLSMASLLPSRAVKSPFSPNGSAYPIPMLFDVIACVRSARNTLKNIILPIAEFLSLIKLFGKAREVQWQLIVCGCLFSSSVIPVSKHCIPPP